MCFSNNIIIYVDVLLRACPEYIKSVIKSYNTTYFLKVSPLFMSTFAPSPYPFLLSSPLLSSPLPHTSLLSSLLSPLLSAPPSLLLSLSLIALLLSFSFLQKGRGGLPSLFIYLCVKSLFSQSTLPVYLLLGRMWIY